MYHIIINPSSKSGKGLSIWKSVETLLSEREIPYRTYISTHIGHVTELTLKITSDIPTDGQPINLILLGGDGTVNEALQGIQDFNMVNIGYIPTGSSNDLARALKLRRNPAELMTHILDGTHSRMLDLGILTYESDTHIESRLHKRPEHRSRYFIVSSGIGFDAAVCEEALSSSIKNTLNKFKLGKLTYLGIALKQLITAKTVSCEICLDGKTAIRIPKFLFSAFMIHPYEGGGFCFCPQADNSDGLLDLCVVGNLPKLLILFALPTAFWGKHYIFPRINHYTASSVRIKTSIPLWVHTDGEVYLKSDQISISCLKQRLRFLV
ncbi:MAG: diacylglycerol kinase family lipid kinase [Lachnospiraceae bacterium]|nr:diacylglycerol kinase family lipid kinase [Lachnospiraceae bacterium]